MLAGVQPQSALASLTDPRLPAPLQRDDRRALLLILCVALLVRAWTWSALFHLPVFRSPDVDALLYHQAAQRIAQGDLAMGGEVLRMSPGYFYLLGGIYALFGDGIWAFRLVHALLGLLLVASIWDCVRRLLGSRWALVGGLCAACYGPFAFYEAAHLGDAVGASMHGFLLWLVIRELNAPRTASSRWGSIALIGCIWGLCTVLRPNALLLALPLGLMCLQLTTTLRVRILSLALLLGAFACTIAPVTLRNVLVARQAVLLTAHGGLNLYVGNGKGATGTYRVLPEFGKQQGPAQQFTAFHQAAERALGRDLSAKEADAYWVQRTVQDILDDKPRWIGLMLKKLRLFWNGRELADVYHYEFYRSLDLRLLAALSYKHIAALGLLGTLLLLFARAPAPRFVALFNLTGSLAIALVFINGRYRLSVVPGAIIAAVFALAWLVEVVKQRRIRTMLPAIVALGTCLAISWPVPIKRSSADEEFFKIAASYHEHGDLADAEWAYLQSLDRNPDHRRSRHNLILLYERAGRRDAALAQLRALITTAQKQHDPQAEQNARMKLQRLQKASP